MTPLAYAEAYFSLGWINEKQFEDQKNYAYFAFPERVRNPNQLSLTSLSQQSKKGLARCEGQGRRSGMRKTLTIVGLLAALLQNTREKSNVLYVKESTVLTK